EATLRQPTSGCKQPATAITQRRRARWATRGPGSLPSPPPGKMAATMRTASRLLSVLSVTLLLAACGGATKKATTTTTAAASSPSTVVVGGTNAIFRGALTVQDSGNTVEIGDNYFEPNVLSGKAGQAVTLDLKNAGAGLHNFSVAEQHIDQDFPP